MNIKSAILAVSALVALVFVTGCEPKSDTSTAAAPDPGRLNIYCWSEYVPQEVIDAFQEETGIRVSMENYSSNEEMLAKLLAGGGSYDIIQPSEYTVEALIADGALEKLDPDQIPNLRNIAPEFRDLAYDPGNQYSVPFMAGTVGIVVNTELVTDEIKGYSDVFQESNRNNIVVLDDAREIVSWGFATLGIPVNDVTDENLEKVKPLLQSWLPLVKVYDSDSPKTALLNGDVALGVVWNGEGARLLEADSKFQWILPAEGAHLFIDSFAIPKNAKNKENALRFMDFILRPEISVMISEEFPYLNPNLSARQIMSDEKLSNPASFPTQEEFESLSIFEDIGEQASQVDEIVTSVKAQ